MDKVGLILSLADTILTLYKDAQTERHVNALFELRKRYEKEKNKDQIDFNLLDTIELDIMHYVELLNFTITKKKTPDL